MDSTFYDRFYSQMTKGTFIGMSRATPEKFQFSIKVPETITYVKRLDLVAHCGQNDSMNSMAVNKSLRYRQKFF
jgi:uncharacterized protein YecE (DUF72 family)